MRKLLSDALTPGIWFFIGYVVSMEIHMPDSIAKAFLRGLTGQ